MRDRTLVGADAERILNDPVYAESWAAVERTLVDLLKGSPMETKGDQERVLNIVRRLQSIDASRKWMDNQMQFGRLAATEKEVAQETSKRSFLNRRGL